MRGNRQVLLLVATLLFTAPTAAVETFELVVDGGRIETEVLPGQLMVSRDELLQWIEVAAHTVSRYYGRFPVSRARLRLVPVKGKSIRGTTWGGATPFLRVSIGDRVTSDELGADWKLTHEMVHLAFPHVGEQHAWIEEGLATYVEPIARARLGALTSEDVWGRFVEGMPNGVAVGTDGGLDDRTGWGRTYWGGALFCLLADVAIREQTEQRSGLSDALVAVLISGGNIQQTWSLERIFAEADQAVGVEVLSTLYAQMGVRHLPVDLNQLWLDLGVQSSEGRLVLDDSAPKAAIRQAITR